MINKLKKNRTKHNRDDKHEIHVYIVCYFLFFSAIRLFEKIVRIRKRRVVLLFLFFLLPKSPAFFSSFHSQVYVLDFVMFVVFVYYAIYIHFLYVSIVVALLFSFFFSCALSHTKIKKQRIMRKAIKIFNAHERDGLYKRDIVAYYTYSIYLLFFFHSFFYM